MCFSLLEAKTLKYLAKRGPNGRLATASMSTYIPPCLRTISAKQLLDILDKVKTEILRLQQISTYFKSFALCRSIFRKLSTFEVLSYQSPCEVCQLALHSLLKLVTSLRWAKPFLKTFIVVLE